MTARPTTPELREGLERALAATLGSPRRVRTLDRRPSEYRSSFGLENLTVVLEDGTALELVFKDLGWQSLDAAGRDAKPRFLYRPLREIEIYRELLAPANLGTAGYYGSVVEPDRDRFWLFLERVAGVELYQVGELSRWQEAARWLAAMHSRFASWADGRDRASLLAHDAGFHRRWMVRAREFARQAGAPRHELARIAWLAERHDEVVAELAALPVTVIHGEFYASNVLVAGADATTRVCPIDWEVAAVGCGLSDLAALTEGWDATGRSALEDAYRDAANGSSACPDGHEEFTRALALCRLQLAIQRLGWAPRRWSPPAEHRRDWLATAVARAEELGL